MYGDNSDLMTEGGAVLLAVTVVYVWGLWQISKAFERRGHKLVAERIGNIAIMSVVWAFVGFIIASVVIVYFLGGYTDPWAGTIDLAGKLGGWLWGLRVGWRDTRGASKTTRPESRP